jgi:hypothetical protein
MKSKLIFRIADTLQVISKSATSNAKIEVDSKRLIVQTYTFSRRQFELIASGGEKNMRTFFSIADSNCLDCPFNSFGLCYTHKFNQYVGFVSMLKSIAKQYPTFESIPIWDDMMVFDAIKMSEGTYVRFGTYGEPSLHPLNLIQQMSSVADNWTGYTHQWMRHNELAPYFMASTHDIEGEQSARIKGYRSYIATTTKLDGIVNCPASKEAGYKSTCSKCGLCAGTLGTKSTKSIFILNH